MRIPLIGPTSEARSLTADAQKTINMYVESGGPGAKSPAGYYGKPGVRALVDALTRPTAIASINGRLFVLAGDLLEYNSSFALLQTTGGITASGAGIKDWILLNGTAPNFLQVLVAGSGGALYYWQDGSGIVATPITLNALAGLCNTSGLEVNIVPGVDTTADDILTAGSQVVTPADMAGIQVNMGLWIEPGSPIAELVTVTAVTPTTFTAVFASGHIGTVQVQANDQWDTAAMVHGTAITIHGVGYTVDYVQNAYTLILQSSAGNQSGVWFTTGTLPLNASSMCFLGGYGIITRPNTRQFNISAPNDFSTWLPLDYELKEGYADHLVRCFAHRQELWLFGRETTEVWDLTGNPDFPFQRNPSGSIKRGLGAMESLVQLADSLFFIGDDGIAYKTQGMSPQRISTSAIENAWRVEFPTVRAIGYEMLGHFFWQINGSVTTWVYDVGESTWTERGLLNTISGNTFYRDIPEFYTHIQEWNGGRVLADEGSTSGMHIVTSYNDTNLYEMSTDFHDDAGTAIRYVRRFAHFCEEKMKLFWHRLVLEAEVGQVASGDPEPVVQLRISEDGAKTWRQTDGPPPGDMIVTQTLGAHGDTFHRIIFRQLGSGRDLVPEVAITAKSKLFIADAYGELTKGNA